VVHNLAAEKNLEVSEHVHDKESEQDEARHCHNGFLADGGVIKTSDSGQIIFGYYRTHRYPPKRVTKPYTVTL
jgi:hypothetical protein